MSQTRRKKRTWWSGKVRGDKNLGKRKSRWNGNLGGVEISKKKPTC